MDALDFLSEQFDPVLALAADDLELPDSDATAMNNLTEYFNAMKGKLKDDPKKKTKPASREEQQETAPNPIRFDSFRPRRRAKNVLTIMENIKGPLGRLRQCMIDSIRVKVWIRGGHKMRGMCHGYILAFDRHWNMALGDVDEIYVVPKRVKWPANVARQSYSGHHEEEEAATVDVAPPLLSHEQNTTSGVAGIAGIEQKPDAIESGAPASEDETPRRKRKHKRSKVRMERRHVDQMLVRGDSVAFVSFFDVAPSDKKGDCSEAGPSVAPDEKVTDQTDNDIQQLPELDEAGSSVVPEVKQSEDNFKQLPDNSEVEPSAGPEVKHSEDDIKQLPGHSESGPNISPEVKESDQPDDDIKQ